MPVWAVVNVDDPKIDLCIVDLASMSAAVGLYGAIKFESRN